MQMRFDTPTSSIIQTELCCYNNFGCMYVIPSRKSSNKEPFFNQKSKLCHTSQKCEDNTFQFQTLLYVLKFWSMVSIRTTTPGPLFIIKKILFKVWDLRNYFCGKVDRRNLILLTLESLTYIFHEFVQKSPSIVGSIRFRHATLPQK